MTQPFYITDRKDFIARCKPLPSSSQSEFVTIDVCTEPDLLREGLRAFPSEHASATFAGLGLLSLMLAREMDLFAGFRPDERLVPSKRLWIGWYVLCFVFPLAFATWCALSQLRNNR